jgi:glycosyltransferase involved in cell wall biosynthesis
MLTVIFASHNGGGDLTKTLDSMARLKSPPGGWQLIAVDNASTDQTGAVLRSYADRLPITVLEESLKGKNRALNCALEAAQGDFYIFTDDDVLVPEDWLIKWQDTAADHLCYDLFAGRTSARFVRRPADWFLKGINAGVVYAAHDPDLPEGPCAAGYMFGTNMAIRASVFAEGARFDASIGPDGSANYAMGSDTEMALRLERQGHRCWFSSGVELEHIVPLEYLAPAWILRRGYRWGRGSARMKIFRPCPPSQLVRKNLLKWVVYPVMLPFLAPEERWSRQWRCMVDRGYEDGTRDLCGKKPRWS